MSIPVSFWRQFLVPEKWRQKTRSHTGKFSVARNFATETCARQKWDKCSRTNLSVFDSDAEHVID